MSASVSAIFGKDLVYDECRRREEEENMRGGGYVCIMLSMIECVFL